MPFTVVNCADLPEKRQNAGHEFWLKRQAIQVAAQLPEDLADAERVLSYTAELIRGFMRP